jgi:hypothetical protein
MRPQHGRHPAFPLSRQKPLDVPRSAQDKDPLRSIDGRPEPGRGPEGASPGVNAKHYRGWVCATPVEKTPRVPGVGPWGSIEGRGKRRFVSDALTRNRICGRRGHVPFGPQSGDPGEARRSQGIREGREMRE